MNTEFGREKQTDTGVYLGELHVVIRDIEAIILCEGNGHVSSLLLDSCRDFLITQKLQEQ